MKSTLKLGLVAALFLFLGGCSPSDPKWEYQTRTVVPSEKDEVLKKSGEQGWELVSTQESRVGSDAEIKDLQLKKDNYGQEIVSTCDLALRMANNSNDTRKVLLSIKNLFVISGDDISRLDQSARLALRFRAGIKKFKGKSLEPLERNAISNSLFQVADLAQRKIEIVKILRKSQSINAKLIFKRQKVK